MAPVNAPGETVVNVSEMFETRSVVIVVAYSLIVPLEISEMLIPVTIHILPFIIHTPVQPILAADVTIPDNSEIIPEKLVGNPDTEEWYEKSNVPAIDET